jgi:CubicO group peptidase (beta-lactamase class C family)
MRRPTFCKSSLVSLALSAALLLGGLAACDQARPPEAKIVAKPAAAPKKIVPAAPLEVDDPRFAPIKVAVQEEIDAGHFPGAVVLVGHRGRVVYRQAFGQRCLEPRLQPMRVDTIFDIASLTKVVATTTAIMQLSEHGLLSIDDPVVKYWPEFGENGKDTITLRQLLTHTSGLREDINPRARWSDYREALQAIAVDKPLKPPGTVFRYSDVNFIVLAEIVRRVSGQSLDVYCTDKIFKPLGLRQTSFNPPKAWQDRISPCNVLNGHLRWGEVQDPTAFRLGGVAGHSGVFSTADDLAVFAQMLLDGGVSRGVRILKSGTVAAMTKPQDIAGSLIRRGLGWDIKSIFTQEFNEFFPAGSFGHTGYTGSSIWIEPRSQTYLIILTNRLHPAGKGRARPLRAKIAAIVAAAVPMGPPAGALDGGGPNLKANQGQ